MIHYEFISPEEERFVLSKIPTSEVKGVRHRNAIWRYGTKIYSNGVVSKEIPVEFWYFANKIYCAGLLPAIPTHITINEYLPGNTIAPHIDKPESGEVITVLSLLSEAEMVLSNGEEKKTLLLPPRSLLQLSGDERWVWKHSILPLNNKRYSIVFRD